MRTYRLIAIAVAAALSVIAAAAQDLILDGTVVDEKGEPLIGAAVMISGSSKGEITDMDGKFSIWLDKKGTTLVVSYIGYQTKEFKYMGQNNITIKLEPDENMLAETVVVGYGYMKKSDLTGAVSSVSSDKIEGYRSSSIAGALSGQIAGVQITQTDGAPGSEFVVNIRGVGTLTGDSSPLYIVDGFQVDDISFLASGDIESTEVLKDASASAIYGSRAANGVVLITTKSGASGKPTVSYNGAASFRQISKFLDVMKPYDFVKLQGEINPSYLTSYIHEAEPEPGEYFRFRTLDDYKDGYTGIDWQQVCFRPTWSQDHSVAIQGGNDQTQYNASFSYYDENGIFVNSGFRKYTGKARIKQKITKNLTFDGSFNYAQTRKSGVGTTGDNGRFNMLAQIISARPTGGNRLTDEQLLSSAIDPEIEENDSNLAQVNPKMQSESVNNVKRSDVWSVNGSLSWEIVKGLTFRTAASYSNTFTRNDVFYGQNSKEAYRNGKTPFGQSQNGKDVRWVNSNYLTWKQKIKKHSYDVMVGQEWSGRSNEWIYGQAMDFPYDYFGNNNLGLGATPSKVDSYYASNHLLSFFARGNYNYANRYLITATVRADGSTVFSPRHKWGFFPSFSAAWRINNEPWMKDVPVVSNLKLRAGWGTVGNDRIANYLSMNLYTNDKMGIGTSQITVFNSKQLANTDLRWEGSSTLNIGLDLGLWKDRLTLTVDAYDKTTKDLLLAQQLAYVTGFGSQMQNIGKIRNRGLELTLNTTNIDKKNFLWQSSFNISFMKNTLVSLADGTDYVQARSGFDSNFTSNDYIAMVGQSLGLIYGYEFDGLYQVDDFYTTPGGELSLKPGVVNNPAYNKGAQPGYVKYKDVNGDGVISTDDRTVIGCALPKFYGGFTNTFAFYGVDLSFMLQFNYGNQVYNATRLYATQTRKSRANMLAEAANRWSQTNANNSVPVFDGYVPNDVYSRFIEDGSFLRLKNLTLGYTLPSDLTKKARIKKIRVYVSGQNLFIVSNYSGYDPEVSTAGNNPMTPGLDWGAYPKSRIVTAGLEIQF